MSYSLIEATPSAYAYPLLIKSLLHSGLTNAPNQQIVYADRKRYDYITLRQRIGRLASALTGLGIQPGRTVGVSGLGQSPLSRMLFCRSQHGRRAAYGECAAVPGADPLHDQSRRGRHPAGARRLPANAGRHQRIASSVSAPSFCCRMMDAGRRRHWNRLASTKTCLRPALRTSCFPTSTRTPAPRRSTPPAPRDCRRA